MEEIKVRNKRQIASDERLVKCIELRIRGFTYKQIGNEFGVSKTRARQIFHKAFWISQQHNPFAFSEEKMMELYKVYEGIK